MTGEPTLAGPAGFYREAAPSPGLRAHFICAWANIVRPDHVGPIAVPPDGCVDILWSDGRLTVAGPDRIAALPPLKPGTSIVGLRFLPGAASHWLGLPMSEIVGLKVELRDFWGRRADDLRDAIGDAASLDERLTRMQALVARIAPEIDRPAGDVAATFARMKRGGENALNDALAELDVSSRTLRRRCHEHLGYGPKTLGRILRFQKFLDLARQRPLGGLAAIAFDAGYADQAHLSRDARELSGLSPAAIQRQYQN